MAETGQIKIFGDHPTRTEAALAKTRRHLHKEERLTTKFYYCLLISLPQLCWTLLSQTCSSVHLYLKAKSLLLFPILESLLEIGFRPLY
jgi:hypothetical protein